MATGSSTFRTDEQGGFEPLFDCALVGGADSAATRYRLRKLPMMQAGDPHALDLGDQISILGFPRGSLGTLTHARGTMDGWARSPNGHGTVMKTRACVAPGDSGAPAIDSTGRVVGVVSCSSGDYSGAVAQVGFMCVRTTTYGNGSLIYPFFILLKLLLLATGLLLLLQISTGM